MLITSAYAQMPSFMGGGSDNMLVSLLPFILIFVIMYFLILRPQQKRVKQHQEMVKNLRRGDTVITSGGTIAAVCAALVDPEADPASFARLWGRFNTVLVNSSVTRVVVGSTGPRLLTFNEHPHLEGGALTYR